MQNFPYHNRYLLYAIGILCGSILAAYIGMLPPKQAQAQSPRAGAFVLYMPIMHTMTKPTTTPTPSGPFFNRAVVVRCDSNEAITYVQGTVRQNGQPVNGHRVVFSWQPDGEVVAGITSGGYPDWAQGYYSHILQAGGPREGNWWFWIQDEAGKRISEMAFVHTDGVAGEGRCQQAVIDFDSQVARPPNTAIPTNTPVVVTPTTTPTPPPGTGAPYEFNIAVVQRCEPQQAGNWFEGTTYKNGIPTDGYRVVYSWQPDGTWTTQPVISGPHPGYDDWATGYYSHIIRAPGQGPIAGNWFVWIVDASGRRISEIANFQTTGPGQGCNQAVVDFDSRGTKPPNTAIPTRTPVVIRPTPSATPSILPTSTPAAPASGHLFKRAILSRCDPNGAVTYVHGTVYQNSQPVNGYRVVFSWQPDGAVVAGITSGPHAGYPGWAPGYYSHILQAGGPREGDWWFWIQDEAGKRISEMAHVHTDGVAGEGKCQQAIINFDS